MSTALLPWPSDVVIVVAPFPETARLDQMESVNPGVCRDCGAAIVYDGFTMRRASADNVSHGRPVKFLCVKCFTKYNRKQITLFEDHRGPENKAKLN